MKCIIKKFKITLPGLLFIFLNLIVQTLLAQTQIPVSEIINLNRSNKNYPWILVGPKQTGIATLGLISAIAVNPENEDKIYAGTQASGLWYTENGGQNWVCLTDNLNLPALGISWIEFDPEDLNTVYFSSGAHGHSNMLSYGAGIFKITNLETPVQVMDPKLNANRLKDFFISKFVFHPHHPEIMYAISTHVFYKLVRNKQSNLWEITYEKEGIDAFFTGKVNSYSNYLFDLEVQNWEGVLQIYISTFRHHSDRPASEFAKAWRNTEELEKDWVEIYSGLPDKENSRYISLEVSMDDPGVLYCLVNKFFNGNGEVYKSRDNGNKWELKTSLDITSNNYGNAVGNHIFIVSDWNKNIAFIGENLLYKSLDFQGKASFSEASVYMPDLDKNSALSTTHADIRAVAEFHQKKAGIEKHDLFIGHDGGISETKSLPDKSNWADSILPANWNCINGDLAIGQAFGFDFNAETGYPVVGLQDNGTQKFNGTGWFQKGWGDGGTVKISRSDPGYVYGQSNSSFLLFNQADFKQDKHNISGNSLPVPRKQYQNMPMLLDPNNDKLLWAGEIKLHRYNPDTKKVEHFPPGGTHMNVNGNDDIRAFDIAASDPAIIFASATDPVWNESDPYAKKVFKSENGGETFSDITANIVLNTLEGTKQILRSVYVTSIKINPHHSDIIYMSLSDYWADLNNVQSGIFRVIKSTDGGMSWVDMSAGLSPFPVSCLLFQEGTEVVLFAGTDAGIYRWNQDMNKWEAYSLNLPKVQITNLEIDYCRSKILCSTWGRGVWQAELQPVDETFVITESETWNENTLHSFNTNVQIKSGVVLTIKGKVSFAEHKYLQVEPGAQLIVEGGKLYNICGAYWEGIRVAGNPKKKQTKISNQGYIKLKMAIIQNAEIGISTEVTDEKGKQDKKKSGGGIVICENTTFKNNKNHLKFLDSKREKYQTGRFTNCVFE